ncbi:hypothetical protein HanXRQr2_Chr05g0213361 [Helianthus annuus]|uniref:Uncharacterized protein n=1 Tax=Helianthus annuus TaxID=4232 RepID=A0A9K3IZ39_HELAN|nr:hypothetical protein HanXRQr2_Chr05g0213361 [Helianthus annuus]
MVKLSELTSYTPRIGFDLACFMDATLRQEFVNGLNTKTPLWVLTELLSNLPKLFKLEQPPTT